ncbi:MAG: histidinol-phosphatase [Erysipelotrichaceae bacterium]|nr:histidinol-phosphatase [Erysipelotrichaceae bacterium]
MKNYHTHTMRCQHAIGTEIDFIEAAIKAGYTTLGFSDHSPWHYESGFRPYMRMMESQLEDYVMTLRHLRDVYKDKIEIKIGLECEYFPDKLDWLKEQIDRYELDYIILGHHYLGSDEYGRYVGHPPISDEQVIHYVDDVCAAIESGLFSYIAHPDVVYYDPDNPLHLKQMERICIKAKEYDIPLEFNLLGFRARRHYPSDAFFTMAKYYNNKIILGCDAHDPEQIENTLAYHKAYALLKKYDFEIVEDIKYFR